MTKESGHIVSGWINTALSGVAVFLLIGVYNRFEKLVDHVNTLEVNQATVISNIEMMNKKTSMLDLTFDNQLKQANHLMDDLKECEMRLDYLEIYSAAPMHKVREKK